MSREKLSSRRVHWTQKVKIDNNTFYLTVGEYADGKPGEIWIEAHKMGTFARGVIDTMARMASIALQCGADIKDVIKAFQGMCFPPDGHVTGEYTQVVEVTSLADWVAQELSNRYLQQQEPTTPTVADIKEEQPDPPPPEKVAGHIAEAWRTCV